MTDIEVFDSAKLEKRGNTALLLIDNPPLNALSHSVRLAIMSSIEKFETDNALNTLIIACSGKTFFVGADIREFDSGPRPPMLGEIVDRLARCRKPIVAAMHGMALGGGLEIALGCHYRIAAKGTRLGLPEVNLGLIPGAGGLRLLPRLIGVTESLALASFGKPISADKAYDRGLVDKVFEGSVIDAGLDFIADAGQLPARAPLDRQFPPTQPETFTDFMQSNARKLGKRDAARAVIEVMQAAATMGHGEAGKVERSVFLNLREGTQSKALRYLFKAERNAAKLPNDLSAPPAKLTAIGILGAGTMGTGIAIACLRAGLSVKMHDPAPAALDAASGKIRKALEKSHKSGRISEAKMEASIAALTLLKDYSGFDGVDLVIEAAYEDIETKKRIFGALAEVAKEDCIFASNTSYLDIDAIARAGGRPRQSLGLHFFSPANVMRLLEVVKGAETDAQTLATGLALAKKLGKIGVIANNAPGFIGNRMFAVRKRETDALLAAGTQPDAIDEALLEFGFAMGPCRVSDLTGLDLGWTRETSTSATIRERLCEAGRLGEKSGAGFFDYDEAGKPHPSPEAKAIIAAFAVDHDMEKRNYSQHEIRARLMWPMVDEAAVLLDEGVAMRESDIDVVWIHGYGWPDWTGGPMFHARQYGLDNVIGELEDMGKKASPALEKLARTRPEQ